jgi:hypothetical protein
MSGECVAEAYLTLVVWLAHRIRPLFGQASTSSRVPRHKIARVGFLTSGEVHMTADKCELFGLRNGSRGLLAWLRRKQPLSAGDGGMQSPGPSAAATLMSAMSLRLTDLAGLVAAGFADELSETTSVLSSPRI